MILTFSIGDDTPYARTRTNSQITWRGIYKCTWITSHI